MEDFIPWVAPISSLPPASEKEEEEEEMYDLIHNFGAWKRKQVASFERTTDVTPRSWVRLNNTQLTGVRRAGDSHSGLA